MIAHPVIESDGTVYNMGNVQGKSGVEYGIFKYPPKINSAGK